MAVFVHRESQFNKLLSKLRKAGGKAAHAAMRAEDIIEKLAAAGRLPPSPVHKLTKHGEARLDGCKKFDLGGGYRLVCLKKADHIFFSHIGTHDECDLWIKNNRKLQPGIDTGPCEVVIEEKYEKSDASEEPECKPGQDWDDFLTEKIEDHVLRKVFQGLCRQNHLKNDE